MTDPKENESFFRKVVRFVANPATDWTDLNSRQDPGGELDLEKSELKAMVERKRRAEARRAALAAGLDPDLIDAQSSGPASPEGRRPVPSAVR